MCNANCFAEITQAMVTTLMIQPQNAKAKTKRETYNRSLIPTKSIVSFGPNLKV